MTDTAVDVSDQGDPTEPTNNKDGDKAAAATPSALAKLLDGQNPKAIAALSDKGYTELSQFGDNGADTDKAEKAINGVLGAWPGVAATLFQKWRAAYPKTPVDTSQGDLATSFAKTTPSIADAASAFYEAGFTRVADLGKDEAEFKAHVDPILQTIKKTGYRDVIHALWLASENEDSPLKSALDKEVPPMSDAAAAFAKNGFATVASLGKDEESFKANVNPILAGIGRQGYYQRIHQLWVDAQRPTAVTPAQLPSGTKVDLSLSSVTLEDKTTFQFPTALGVSATSKDFTAARNLTDADWMTLARKLWMLHGLDLTKALAGEDDAKAPKAALIWQVPQSGDYIDASGFGRVESRTTTSKALHNLAKSQVYDVKANVNAPYVSVAAGYGHDEKSSSSTSSTTLYVTAMYRYVYATIYLDECTAVSQTLVSDLRTALGMDSGGHALPGVDNSQDARYERLSRVFAEYGHVVPSVLHIGASLYFQDEKELTAELTESQVKATAEAAVSVTVGPASGGVSADYAQGTAKKDEAQSGEEAVSFHTIGGDLSQTSSPGTWAPSTGNPNSWVIVGRSGLRPLLDVLQRDSASHPILTSTAASVWEQGQRDRWNGHAPPAGIFSTLFDGQPFTMQHAGTLKQENRSGAVLGTSLVQRADMDGYVPVAGYTWRNLLAIPDLLKWRARYAGGVDPISGLPLYYLVDLNSKFALSAPAPDTKPAQMAPYFPPTGSDPTPSLTDRDLWVLIPADDVNTDDDALPQPPQPRRFAIRHFITNYVLGKEAENPRWRPNGDDGAKYTVGMGPPTWLEGPIPDTVDLWRLTPVSI